MGISVLTPQELGSTTIRATGNQPELPNFGGLDSIIEEPIWKTLWNSLHDALFPKKLPPL